MTADVAYAIAAIVIVWLLVLVLRSAGRVDEQMCDRLQRDIDGWEDHA